MMDVAGEMIHARSCPHADMEPGQRCLCGWRKPHPKKSDSPLSLPHSFRLPNVIPTDDEGNPIGTETEAEIFKRNQLDCLAHAGLDDSKFSKFKLYTLAHALILQSRELKNFGGRSA